MYRQAFLNMNVTPMQYVMGRGLPLAVGGFIVGLLLMLLGPAYMPRALATALGPVIVVLAMLMAFMWPLAETEKRRRQIDDALPFFMTHFGVLSTSNLPRTEVLRLLARKKEYQALSVELERLHDLVTNWNMALPDAARQVSEMTPSQIFSDFLERLAYALESGQDMEAFLRAEQSTVLREYASVYENSVYRIEGWKDIYTSAVMSAAFFVIFANMIPILIGGDPVALLIGVLGFTLLLEALLAVLLRGRLPADRLLHRMDVDTPDRRRHRLLVMVAAPAAIMVFAVASVMGIGMDWAFASATLPLAAAGIWSQVHEARVKRREENFPAFIRSLGSAAQARGGGLTDTLGQVRAHNFGPLSQLIDRLYVRLTWRLDDERSWRHFAAESGSHLVDAFMSMFVEGTSAGGKPGAIGEMISDNVVRILGLRSGRYSAASTFRGLIFALTGSMAFVMFIGLSIVSSITTLFQDAFNEVAQDIPINLAFVLDVDLAAVLILSILMVHALISGFLVKWMEGGRITGGLLYFTGMVWLAVAIGHFTRGLAPGLLSI